MDRKSREILKTIVAGHSCEQVLAANGTLTYHDIFHALTEAPTGFWEKNSGRITGEKLPGDTTSVRKPARPRRD